MNQSIFNKAFFQLEDDTIELKLIDTYEGKGDALPFYWWDIILKVEHVPVGKISFRIGQNYHSYYNGNVGYEVDEPYRGHHYALRACQLMINRVAKYHGMDHVRLTCNVDNIASYKTIEKLGARLVEVAAVPRDYVFWYEGIPDHRIYELTIE